MADVKQVQDDNNNNKKKKLSHLQLLLAGANYSGDTEKDGERNEMKDPWRQVHLTSQVLAQTHCGVLL